MEEKNNEINKNIDSSNIFDEFIDDSNLIEEVDKIKKDENKDLFYYISKVWRILQSIFLFWLISTIMVFSYIHYQKDDTLWNSNILDPFCPVILWDITNKDSYCSSVAYLLKEYAADLALLKKSQNEDILGILEKLNRIKNFSKSKEVLFLADKSENKLAVLTILEKFDIMKNDFIKDKQKIQCNNIVIQSEDSTLSMSCVAYAEGFEKWILWFDWTKEGDTRKWTSLSLANSFLNYIEKQSKVFDIVERQKMFSSEDALWSKTGFSNQTSFTLKLKYNIK